MILTGDEIQHELKAKRIVISPFAQESIEPNSYGFRLDSNLICYDNKVIDACEKPIEHHYQITKTGFCLKLGHFYLGSTLETMGSDFYAATLHARRSVSTMGMWIQFSAPLGHTGAKIPWTLEIMVAHPIIVYPGMLIGKIAFWQPLGDCIRYKGKYTASTDVVASRLSQELYSKQGGF